MSKKARKRKLETEEQSVMDWEQNIFTEEIKNEVASMWEIPQIFHFLHLAKEALNIPHLSMYEMERMLLIPRASKQLANIMTSLLSSPMTKAKWRKIPPMPYEFWTNILAYKMKSWFKIYEAKHRDPVKVLETIGVEPEFWNVFPDAPLLNGKDFEQLTFRQKVWLMKTVCDTVMHTRKTVQEEIAKQPPEVLLETLLGTDRYGARYIYFPQFLKNDLRIYRHCLNNKILSTVKPIKPKLEAQSDNRSLDQGQPVKKRARQRRRRKRWSSGVITKPKKRSRKCNEKQQNDCKCSSDSATGSLINEETNLSSISTCSNNNTSTNNNNDNNNDISLDTVDVKRLRSLSKCSEISSESDRMPCKSTKSSGYDTNNSLSSISNERLPQRMFKGFSVGNGNDKCKIEIISRILTDLKSGNTHATSAEDISFVRTSQSKLQQYLDTVDLHRNDSVDRAMDSLSSICKTDDEKLHEIISAENSKLNDKNPAGRVARQLSVVSKSDDEKLNETRTVQRQNDQEVVAEGTFIKEDARFVEGRESHMKTGQSDKAQESTNDGEIYDTKDLSLRELRSLLQREAMENEYPFDQDNESEYSLKNGKMENLSESRQGTEDFNQMLLELSCSKFQLVADSVASLRELISSFSQKSGSPTTDTDFEHESIPPCEIKLVKQMKELLSSLEEIEPALKESTRRAKGKLQKEWTNFTEGAEDQDSSGEGLGSNWWVLGSQGCSLPIGDASLQTLPHPTVPATGAPDKHTEEQTDRKECGKSDEQECAEPQAENPPSEVRGEQSERGEASGQENTGPEEKAKEDSNEEEGEQQSRRVLRARGISSYTEQFYSDDEIEEKELEEWTDVEAVYAAPGTQADSSSSHVSPKIKCPHDRTNEEDSDQDWILPGSRKRKNKRPSASRRLKSFQQKLQSIKMGALQDAAESYVAYPLSLLSTKEKPRIKEIQIYKPNESPVSSEVSNSNSIVENNKAVVENSPNVIVPSTETICKLENITSVHSELDIKDEGPIYDSIPWQSDTSYTTTFNPNYVMLNADSGSMSSYVVQPSCNTIDPQNTLLQSGSMVSNIIPPIQQGYYVQGGHNYFIQNPQTSFVPPAHFQPQGPQVMMPQQVINYPGYIPYMIATDQSQPEYVTTDQQIISHQIVQTPVTAPHLNSNPGIRPQQNRYPVSRQNYSYPNGAVIRSCMPPRGNMQLANNAKPLRNPQQRSAPVRMQRPHQLSTSTENSGQKTTSLIVLSDSDDEIEMIITEKTGHEVEAEKTNTTPRNDNVQARSRPIAVSETSVTPKKIPLPPRIIQRMNRGGISITPVKSTPQVQNTGTQLVVVVNETGSHYALALPNGSKLILTPEQVAQIRASNGGKLVL